MAIMRLLNILMVSLKYFCPFFFAISFFNLNYLLLSRLQEASTVLMLIENIWGMYAEFW